MKVKPVKITINETHVRGFCGVCKTVLSIPKERHFYSCCTGASVLTWSYVCNYNRRGREDRERTLRYMFRNRTLKDSNVNDK